MPTFASDAKYLEKFLEPIRLCAQYQPKFGLGNKAQVVDCQKFLEIYGNDPFYAWCGLDSELMYVAHKAAGGMTSIYRQIGKGCEYIFREIIIDKLYCTARESADWSYTTKTQYGKEKKLSLDARIEFNDIKDNAMLSVIKKWSIMYSKNINAHPPQNGIVFEVRQGYKSKDSKRQNADIDNIAVAWSQGYLPIFAVFSSQIDKDIVLRYHNSRGGILIGSLDDDDMKSLFAFSKNILLYDLVAFFERNTMAIKQEINSILNILLSTHNA